MSRLSLLPRAVTALLAVSAVVPASALTTSSGQIWNDVPDAWTRGNDADTSYFGWDAIEQANAVLGMGRVLDDATPDLGAIGSPAQRLYQGTAGAADPSPTTYGHRSGSGNYYSGFGATDVVNDTITGVAPASGAGGFTTLVLQVIAGAPSGMGANALTGMSFSLPAQWTKQKDLYGVRANGTGVYWQEWTAPGAGLGFQLAIGSTESSRSIDAIQVDTRWSPTQLINSRTSIGVPEPTATGLALLAMATFGIAVHLNRRPRATARSKR